MKVAFPSFRLVRAMLLLGPRRLATIPCAAHDPGVRATHGEVAPTAPGVVSVVSADHGRELPKQREGEQAVLERLRAA